MSSSHRKTKRKHHRRKVERQQHNDDGDHENSASSSASEQPERRLPTASLMRLTDEQRSNAIPRLRIFVDAILPKDDDDLLQDFDDNSLARFLLAREGNVEDAETALKASVEWRNQIKPHLLSTTDSELAQIEKLGTLWIHGKDKLGRPVIYIKPGGVNPATVEKRVQFLVMRLEQAIRQMDGDEDQLVWICDFGDYGSRGRSPGGFATARQSVEVLQNQYPERLGALFVVNAPFFFSAVYFVVAPFMTARTKAKIEWISGDEQSVRTQLNRLIDDSNIDPKLFQ